MRINFAFALSICPEKVCLHEYQLHDPSRIKIGSSSTQPTNQKIISTSFCKDAAHSNQGGGQHTTLSVVVSMQPSQHPHYCIECGLPNEQQLRRAAHSAVVSLWLHHVPSPFLPSVSSLHWVFHKDIRRPGDKVSAFLILCRGLSIARISMSPRHPLIVNKFPYC